MDQLATIGRIAWIDGDVARRARVRAWADGICSVVEYEPDGHLEEFDAFVVDAAHPRVSLERFIADLRGRGLDTPVLVIVTDQSQIGPALRAGAWDVLREPFERECCEAALRRVRERQALAKTVRALQIQLAGIDEQHGVVPLRELERRAIEKALAATRGSVEKAARMLGMGRATLYRRLATMSARPSSA